ncbi:GDYXXLXY domain-containing protein [Parasphingorhabdus sp.]|uniref:GDYXXLXY domain-containing protein n=1 Tax=Parasphingorhabdus sp. TaxID=2709688 RepID=UPI003A91E2EE
MNRYRQFFLPAALLLPIFGLGLIWILTDREADQGTVWDVPIAGYDPRDLLRGHYVQFRYDWPALEADTVPTWSGSGTSLCIIGRPPEIASVSVRTKATPDLSSAAGCDSIVKVNPWSEEGGNGLIRDRIYVPQTSAGAYQAKLRDSKLQGIVRIRVNNSGFITPLSLDFQSRDPETPDPEDAE